MIIKECFSYRAFERITRPDGVRHYVCPDTGQHLPSVTTILSATADHKELDDWRERVGDKKADEIRDEACALGTLMHTHLENHVFGQPRPRGTNKIRVMASTMSDVIIQRGLCHVNEVWGSEVILHTPGLYAGTTDLVGLYKNVPAIMDYKTSKKMKSWSNKIVQDYAAQAAAYTLSHNWNFDTSIKTCVIFMVDRDLNFETFVVEGLEFKKAVDRWTARCEEYYQKYYI